MIVSFIRDFAGLRRKQGCATGTRDRRDPADRFRNRGWNDPGECSGCCVFHACEVRRRLEHGRLERFRPKGSAGDSSVGKRPDEEGQPRSGKGGLGRPEESRLAGEDRAPLAGSILPASRIVAFYGNPLSKRMGVLGEIPADQMLAKLDKEIAAWQRPIRRRRCSRRCISSPSVAQGAPGRDGMYRLRMTRH